MGAKTILCVDDESAVLDFVQEMLQADGHDVLTAASGEQGLSVLQSHPVQVVVTDQCMPGMPPPHFIYLSVL